MTKLRRIAAIAAATAALTSALVSSAQAHVTIGQLAPGTAEAQCTEPFDALQFGLRGGTDYVVRETGAITSWSTNARAGAGQKITFKVFRPSGSGYTVVAHDERALTPSTVNTFKVNIPVKLNDVIGINTANASPAVPNACSFLGVEGGSFDDVLYAYLGNAADGAALGAQVENRELRVNVSATVLPPPEINILGKVSLGSLAGGGSVVLKGNHFEEVTGVSFGGVPATKFTVSDEHQLTAIAPPGKTLGEIAATVTTPAGTATAPPRFAYSGCVVPKLAGKKLAVAKTKIKAAGCALGKVKRVRGPKGKRGKVVKQSPKPGKVGVPGTKVSIKVGK